MYERSLGLLQVEIIEYRYSKEKYHRVSKLDSGKLSSRPTTVAGSRPIVCNDALSTGLAKVPSLAGLSNGVY